jgi:hypothetical protein
MRHFETYHGSERTRKLCNELRDRPLLYSGKGLRRYGLIKNDKDVYSNFRRHDKTVKVIPSLRRTTH